MTFIRSEPPWFAFLIHPRDIHDLFRWKGSRLLRQYSSSDEDFLRKATSCEPMVIGELLFGFGGARGELLGVMRMPEQMAAPGARQAVAQAVQLAAQRGARVVGLGALTAPATAAGRTLVSRLPRGLTVTTGNAYTAAVTRSNVVEAASALALNRPARVAVLGATGSVGGPASRLLVQAGFDVTLIGRSLARVSAALGDLAGQALFSEELLDLRDADIVLVLTSGVAARVSTELVSGGAVVIDVAQPVNIPEREYGEFLAKGVTVVPGGLVRIPNYRSTYDFALADPTTVYACLAEAYVMVCEGIREHSVGPIPVETALRMERIAERRSVRPVSLDLAGASTVGPPPNAAVAVPPGG